MQEQYVNIINAIWHLDLAKEHKIALEDKLFTVFEKLILNRQFTKIDFAGIKTSILQQIPKETSLLQEISAWLYTCEVFTEEDLSRKEVIGAAADPLKEVVKKILYSPLPKESRAATFRRAGRTTLLPIDKVDQKAIQQFTEIIMKLHGKAGFHLIANIRSNESYEQTTFIKACQHIALELVLQQPLDFDKISSELLAKLAPRIQDKLFFYCSNEDGDCDAFIQPLRFTVGEQPAFSLKQTPNIDFHPVPLHIAELDYPELVKYKLINYAQKMLRDATSLDQQLININNAILTTYFMNAQFYETNPHWFVAVLREFGLTGSDAKLAKIMPNIIKIAADKNIDDSTAQKKFPLMRNLVAQRNAFLREFIENPDRYIPQIIEAAKQIIAAHQGPKTRTQLFSIFLDTNRLSPLQKTVTEGYYEHPSSQIFVTNTALAFEPKGTSEHDRVIGNGIRGYVDAGQVLVAGKNSLLINTFAIPKTLGGKQPYLLKFNQHSSHEGTFLEEIAHGFFYRCFNLNKGNVYANEEEKKLLDDALIQDKKGLERLITLLGKAENKTHKTHTAALKKIDQEWRPLVERFLQSHPTQPKVAVKIAENNDPQMLAAAVGDIWEMEDKLLQITKIDKTASHTYINFQYLESTTVDKFDFLKDFFNTVTEFLRLEGYEEHKQYAEIPAKLLSHLISTFGEELVKKVLPKTMSYVEQAIEYCKKKAKETLAGEFFHRLEQEFMIAEKNSSQEISPSVAEENVSGAEDKIDLALLPSDTASFSLLPSVTVSTTNEKFFNSSYSQSNTATLDLLAANTPVMVDSRKEKIVYVAQGPGSNVKAVEGSPDVIKGSAHGNVILGGPKQVLDVSTSIGVNVVCPGKSSTVIASNHSAEEIFVAPNLGQVIIKNFSPADTLHLFGNTTVINSAPCIDRRVDGTSQAVISGENTEIILVNQTCEQVKENVKVNENPEALAAAVDKALGQTTNLEHTYNKLIAALPTDIVDKVKQIAPAAMVGGVQGLETELARQANNSIVSALLKALKDTLLYVATGSAIVPVLTAGNDIAQIFFGKAVKYLEQAGYKKSACGLKELAKITNTAPACTASMNQSITDYVMSMATAAIAGKVTEKVTRAVIKGGTAVVKSGFTFGKAVGRYGLEKIGLFKTPVSSIQASNVVNVGTVPVIQKTANTL